MEDWKQKFQAVTWDEYRANAFHLASQIKEKSLQFDLLVAVARGGLTLSQLLSDSLNLPIAAFTIQSYKDLRQAHLPTVTYPLSGSLAGKKILLVDDISDLGKTFLRSLDHLTELGAQKENIITCAMIYKPHSVYKPDFYSTLTSSWVIMPYEVRETIDQVAPLWIKENVPMNEIRSRFQSFGFSPEQVAYFLKNHGTLS